MWTHSYQFYTNTVGRRATKVSLAGNVDSLVLIYTINTGRAGNMDSLVLIYTINTGRAGNMDSLVLIKPLTLGEQEIWTHSY